MELHERIAFVRKAAGLTQEQLGEKLGVTRQAVSKWESAQATPDALTVARLCSELGVSADFVPLGKEPDGAAASAPPVAIACPCCGKNTAAGTLKCQDCSYDFYPTPPDDDRQYAVLLLGCSDTYNAPSIMMRFTHWDKAQCDQTLRALSTYGADRKESWLLRRGLPLSAALHIATCLRKCCGIRIIADDPIPGTDTPALSDEALEGLPEATPCPEPPEEQHSGGIGFWGIVGAVLLAIVIASFL